MTISSQSVACLVTFIMISFVEQKFFMLMKFNFNELNEFVLMKSNLSFYFFEDDVFCVLLKNSLPGGGVLNQSNLPPGTDMCGCHSGASTLVVRSFVWNIVT